MHRTKVRNSTQFFREELRGGSELETDAVKDESPLETVNLMQESDYSTEKSKRKFTRESFKIDENEILNRDKKLKED